MRVGFHHNLEEEAPAIGAHLEDTRIPLSETTDARDGRG